MYTVTTYSVLSLPPLPLTFLVLVVSYYDTGKRDRTRERHTESSGSNLSTPRFGMSHTLHNYTTTHTEHCPTQLHNYTH